MARRSLVLLAGLVLAGCGGSHPAAPDPAKAPRSLEVSSPAFPEGGAIPATYTCKGAGRSPELHWSEAPEGARSFALVVDDPDAPNGTYTHWVVVNIPAGTTGVDAGGRLGTELRGSGGVGWKPPCPPSGTHHYRFSVYALTSEPTVPTSSSLDAVMRLIAAKAVAWGRLTGTVTAD